MTTEQCKKFLQLLDDYLDRVLEPEQQAEVERHLEECARCRHELEAHQRIITSLQQLEKVSAPETLRSEVVARLQEQGARIPLRARIQELLSPRKLQIALEVAAVFIVVFVGWHIFRSPSLQLTLGEKKQSTPAEMLYMTERADKDEAARSAPASVSPGEAVAPIEREVSKEAMEKRETEELKTVVGLEKGVSKEEVEQLAARPAESEGGAIIAIPSLAPPQREITGEEKLGEQKEYKAMAGAPVAPKEEPFMLKEKFEFLEAPAQVAAPVQKPVAELERTPREDEKRTAFGYEAYFQPATPESKPVEQALTEIEPAFTKKAKPEEKVADYIGYLPPKAPAVTPELAGEAAAPRRQVLQENGILVQGPLPQPAVSPSAGISIGDVKKGVERDLAMEQQELLRRKKELREIPTAPATLVISAQPRRERGILGTSVRVPELGKQAKLVERILRQNRGNVVSLQEGKEEISIRSQLPASAYTRFVEQLERQGFTIRREVVPGLGRELEGKADTSKDVYRFYDEVRFRDGRESRELVQKTEQLRETAPLGLVGKQPGARLAPATAAAPELSISLTIIIQGSSPPRADTP